MTEVPKYQADGRYQLPLYVTEKQIIERMGVGIHSGRKAIREMRKHPRFPPQTIGAKRYWPLVVDFLDHYHGRAVAGPAEAPASKPYRGRAWDNLEAAQARVEKRIELATANERRFAALEASIGRRLDPALLRDPEIQSFLISEEARMARRGSRRRPSLEVAHVAQAEHRLKQARSPRET
ncbi:hypothetical protein AB8A20_07910 [Tardiphaga sp. 604_B6_N1_1]|uniref:hypothetical protein n=1 Tax=unclassified Tardiphaga TaxID=2631404 RepID=UPI003F28CC36